MMRFGLGLWGLTLALSQTLGCGSDDAAGSGGKTGTGGSSTTGGAGGASAGSGGANTGGSSAGGGSGGASAGAGGGGASGTGIAAKYPGDVGIEADPDVIFADDFESHSKASDLSQKWDNFFQVSQTRIATETGNVFAGQKSLEFTLPKQNNELSNAVQKVLTTELDQLYLRWYSKFDKSFDVSGSSHNGGGISAHYFVNGQATPGVPADGKNKFLVDFECWRGETKDKSPGQLNTYIYHPEQRSQWGDHFFPSGIVLPNSSLPFDFGANFVPHAELTPDLDRWYAYELMVKANTVGQRDGRITLWVDGVVLADFGNLRFRDIDSLKIDRIQLSLHAGQNPVGETKKWYDNVVAAKSYIGPMAK